ncbi:hypothetical protein GCK32_016276 [Trichostrongylus colubriformis]|uniref:BAAT/Acyl-CoA thioester hydrolase C-terminal domain-containing protein n=1 Tax=Trichostrongylus colubriformis TaxID=6319 RepID=A0AAN8F6Q2_TRICO
MHDYVTGLITIGVEQITVVLPVVLFLTVLIVINKCKEEGISAKHCKDRDGPFPAVIDISGTGGGIHEHKLDAVVAINGPHAMSDYVNLKENGKPLPQATLANDKIRFINGTMASDKLIQHSEFDETNEIPLHRTSHHTSFRIVIHLVNGGHFMEPPYFPHHGVVHTKFQGFCCGFGGDAVLHGKSQEVTWQATIEFFKRKLGKPAEMPDWNRLKSVNPASHL